MSLPWGSRDNRDNRVNNRSNHQYRIKVEAGPAPVEHKIVENSVRIVGANNLRLQGNGNVPVEQIIQEGFAPTVESLHLQGQSVETAALNRQI